jgi:ABC-type iron transport system FetAB permease component
MVNLNSSFDEWLSRNSNSSTSSNNVKSINQTGTIITMFGISAIVLIAVILVSYRLYHEICTNKKQKKRQRSSCSRRISSIFPVQNAIISDRRRVSAIYLVPVRSSIISDSRGVSSLYPVRSNTISIVTEELPPSYHTAIQSNSSTRL